MKPIAPPRIERGQTLGIVAPAGPIHADRLKRGIARLGDAFKIRVANSVTAPRPPDLASYLSATDNVRAGELNAMLADPDVRAILVARGGYGLMRILSRLDPRLLRGDPKPIVGFSDAVALLSWAYGAGVRGIHGPMVAQLENLPEADITHLIEVLTDTRVPGIREWALVTQGPGVLTGPLITSNLTIASMLVGTPWALPIEGAIVVLEEVGEKPYEIDRYLTQLMLTGELAKIRGVVVGTLTRCIDPNPPVGGLDPEDAAVQVFLERFAVAGTPIALGAPIGHGHRNEAVPFGAKSVLNLDTGTLEITEAAVS